MRLQEGIERTLGQRCDVSVPTTVDEMVSYLKTLVVQSSTYVLLLQTAGVLSQPWALLAGVAGLVSLLAWYIMSAYTGTVYKMVNSVLEDLLGN